MVILGIDPGTSLMGYGVVDGEGDRVAPLAFGALASKARSPIGERLRYMYGGLIEIIARYRPQEIAVESPFVARNARSAIAIGRAQAIAILAAATSDIPIFEYTPAQVKQRVTSFGAAGKEQVGEMVRLQLGLTEIPRPADAADALAVALCHLHEMRLAALLREGR
jgi:crossover junction endodeoxyribonuclease RuvC